MAVEFFQADYRDPQQAQAVVALLNDYACDPMGGGEPLSEAVKHNLCDALAERKDAFSVLCYVDGKPAGLVNCFEGFSTFKCRPLINIHDVTVSPRFRGQGISRGLLETVETIARERNCCKLTLEVLQGNTVAQQAYRRVGFQGYQLDSTLGQAMFWEKPL